MSHLFGYLSLHLRSLSLSLSLSLTHTHTHTLEREGEREREASMHTEHNWSIQYMNDLSVKQKIVFNNSAFSHCIVSSVRMLTVEENSLTELSPTRFQS